VGGDVRVGVGERGIAREALEEDATQAVDVTGHLAIVAAELLGGHAVCEPRTVEPAGPRAGDPELAEERHTAGADPHLVRVEPPVHQAAVMAGGEARGDLLEQPHRLL
jgi:hypothetical protein